MRNNCIYFLVSIQAMHIRHDWQISRERKKDDMEKANIINSKILSRDILYIISFNSQSTQ